MVESCLIPQMQQDMARSIIFQQEGAPPHFHHNVTTYLSHVLPVWIQRGGSIMWPRERHCPCSLLPTTLHQLRAQITNVIAQVDADMLRQIWDEIPYWWDICCQVT
jgi:hypothetical protein